MINKNSTDYRVSDFQTGVQASPVCLTIYMRGLNGRHTDRTLRMMVPTIGYPIGLFVLIACAGQGVVKATARHFTRHGTGSGTALAGVRYSP